MPRVQLPAVTPKRKAWNKGRIVGQKRPLLPKQVWAIRARLELANNLRDLALFNVAIDSKLRGCDLVRLSVVDLVKKIAFENVFPSSRAKPSGLFSLKLRKTQGKLSWLGSTHLRCWLARSCFPAASTIDRISQPVNMGGWCMIGWHRLVWNQADTERIRFAEPKRLISTGKQETCVRCSCCWDILRSTAQYAISVSSWKMRLA